MFSVIIPAFNEENTVAEVVRDALQHPDAKEVIVVDDGSTDRTADRAQEAGARVITLPENKGKGNAMSEGVAAASENIILFLDADVLGMTPEKISALVAPVLSGKYSMFVGVKSRNIVFFNKYFHYFPIIGGERALVKSLWNKVPASERNAFKIEIAMNYASKKRTENGMGFMLVHGLTHFIKEKKYGFWKGFKARLGLIRDVCSISLKLYVFNTVREFFR